MNLSKKSRIAMVTHGQPKVRHMDEHGEVVEEKLPGVKVRRKMVFASGHVGYLILADGKSVGTFGEAGRPDPANPENGQACKKLRDALAKGALLFSECPYDNGTLEGKKACRPGKLWTWHPKAPGRVLVEEESCHHIKDIIAHRKAAQKRRQDEFYSQFESAPEKFYKAELARQARDAQERETNASE